MPVHAAQPGLLFKNERCVHARQGYTVPLDGEDSGEFYPAKYYFTVDYTDSEIADDPAQHKQSHVLELLMQASGQETLWLYQITE